MTEPDSLHESQSELDAKTLDMHRAYRSLMEELEAVDWYSQRIDATRDPELAAILAHNRDEEKEHAAMVLEWIRRRDPLWDELLRKYLFSTGQVEMIEEQGEAETPRRALPADLGVGSLGAKTDGARS